MDPLESTPLGLARKAIDAAASEIAEAYDVWMNEANGAWGYSDMEIEPDGDSLGFALVLNFDDGPREDAAKVGARLVTLLVKHGIGTVRCVGYVADAFAVPDPVPVAVEQSGDDGPTEHHPDAPRDFGEND